MSQGQHTNPGWSLGLRVLLAGAVVVVVFAVLAGLAVDRAFRSSMEELGRERLLARIYMLMGTSEVDAAGNLSMPAELPEPTLATPGSGSYAAITDAAGDLLWRSDSSIGLEVPYPGAGDPGDTRLNETVGAGGGLLQSLAYPVLWELGDGTDRVFIFQAAESRAALDTQLAAFRDTLRLWLGGGAIALLLLQAAVLLWSLSPVRRVAEEVRAIEAGETEALGSDHPRELRPLTENLNALIRGREARLRRYRNALADLAHSLKTPLAVLRTTTEAGQATADHATLREQLDRMDETIEYQLQRAAVSGRSPLTGPVPVNDTARRIVDSLEKIYREKSLEFACEIPPGTSFRGDPGDLAEILGNLGDNACKWGRSQVRFRAHNDADPTRTLLLSVEDDGPGIPEDLRQAVLQRGVRADSRLPGQGIGLAVVRETVEDIYQGDVHIDASELGGTRVRLRIP
jgi:two-component system sensor histidine kinase PhoQ